MADSERDREVSLEEVAGTVLLSLAVILVIAIAILAFALGRATA